MRTQTSYLLSLLSLGLGLAVAAPAAHAEASITRYAPAIGNMERDDLLDWLDKVDRDLAGPKFRHLSSDDRERIERAERTIRKMLDDVPALAGLNETQRVELVNTTQQIVGLLNDTENNRMICTREEITGSHAKVVICMTKAERQLAADITKQSLFDIERKHSPQKPGNGLGGPTH